MPSSGIVDLAIGLVFVFGVTAALASAVTELISRLLGLRAAYLLSGLRELLDSGSIVTDLGQAKADYNDIRGLMAGGQQPAAATGPSATAALLGGPILGSQGMPGQADNRTLMVSPPKKTDSHAPNQSSSGLLGLWRNRRSLPSYISARSFADALIDLLVPNAGGQTTLDAVERSLKSLQQELPVASPLVQSLQTLVANANGNIGQFRTSLENWYDNHMDRVSGWYKRHVAKITLVIGAILVLLLNINTLTIGRTLYSSSVIGTAVSNVAAKTTSCQGQNQQDCLAGLQAHLSAAAQGGLPIGWATVAACAKPKTSCNWLDQRGILSPSGGSGWEVVLVLIGFAITVIALTPGARFWFDLLGRLGSLRSTGPKPSAPAT